MTRVDQRTTKNMEHRNAKRVERKTDPGKVQTLQNKTESMADKKTQQHTCYTLLFDTIVSNGY